MVIFNETDCILAGQIYRSSSYNAVLGILIIVNAFAIFIVLKAVIVLYKAKSFHFNLRMLILNIAMAILARTSLTTTRAVIRIIHVIIEENECNFLSTKLQCKAESTLQSLPLDTIACTFPFVCLERFIATILNEKYEKRKVPIFVFTAIAITWLYPSYNAAIIIMNETRQNLVPYCSSVTDATSIDYRVFLSFYFELPTFCVVVSTLLYFYCKYKKGSFMKTRPTEHSLTARYQLTEIIKTTRYVIPLCLVLCFLLFFQIIALFLSVKTFNANDLRTFSVIKWLYPSYNAAIIILNKTRQNLVPYCSSVTEATSIDYRLFLSFYFELPTFCVVVSTLLYFYCKYKKGSFMKTRPTEHSLTARYQLTEIIKTTRYVIPLCLVLCFLLFFQIIALFLSVKIFNANDLRTFSVIKEITSLLVVPIYAIFFGFLFYLRHRLQYCKHLQKFFGRGVPIQPTPNEIDIYFKIYANDWK